MNHLRSNLLLLAFTVAVCCVVYPFALLGIGRVLFPTATSGSLVGARGSRLIAQPFTADEYFWPRPSAAAYNATASGGSNWGASNPKLRDRVCRQLGPMVRYRAGSASAASGRTPQQDIEAWVAAAPKDAPVAAAYFDLWLSDPANAAKAADLERVPVDMVTASGSGLDPHITLRNVLSVYQLDRVAAKRTPPGGDVEQVRSQIAELARKQSFTPLSGLVGEPLVNVLELNVELDRRFPVPPAAKAP
jgi:K+-transporting ATPase c subunit